MLVLDFETRSRADLKAVGVDKYATDLSTDILCVTFWRDGVMSTWYPNTGIGVPAMVSTRYPNTGIGVPAMVLDAIEQGEEVYAHNARFDSMIWDYVGVDKYGFPEIEPEQWCCSSAQARVNALPSSLDDATRAFDTKHKKSKAGAALIRKLSVPNKKTGEFVEDPDALLEMGAYCESDVLATVDLLGLTTDLTKQEKHDWHVNERINDRGVKIDVELATLALNCAAQCKADTGVRLAELTDGAVNAHTETKRVLDWFTAPLEPHQIPTCIKKNGKLTLDKAARAGLLELELPADVREVIELVDDASKSSVAKFKNMIDRADPDDRVRGAFVYAGAGQTKRYASRGLQLHNMGRDCFKADEAEALKADMRAGKPIPAPVMHTLAKLLRPALIPEDGYTFVVGDWSAIEARVLPWLAGVEKHHATTIATRREELAGARGVLAIFMDENADIYVKTAEDLGVDDRQIGKVANLSLGYGGANGAFHAMAKNYGLKIADSAVTKVVKKWRTANQWAVRLWAELERASRQAVRNPGKVKRAGRARYVYSKDTEILTCILPDDSTIKYPRCREDQGNIVAMKASVKPRADSDGEWPTMQLWGGFLAENITQATAAALLRDALAVCDREGLRVVGHVHDELILEVLTTETDAAMTQLQTIMETPPHWAEGLPLKAVPEKMTRYGK